MTLFMLEAEYSFINRELAKERSLSGKLGIKFAEFLEAIHEEMESEWITKDDVRLFLRHISAGGEIILASKFGIDFVYIVATVLRPILFSKIISYFSEVAYRNGGIISFSEQFAEEFAGKIQNDAYIMRQARDKGFVLNPQKLKDFIKESAEIA
ncbi:MAG: hypothetical protein ACTSVC_09620 [Promethearchaeota archaeon]